MLGLDWISYVFPTQLQPGHVQVAHALSDRKYYLMLLPGETLVAREFRRPAHVFLGTEQRYIVQELASLQACKPGNFHFH